MSASAVAESEREAARVGLRGAHAQAKSLRCLAQLRAGGVSSRVDIEPACVAKSTRGGSAKLLSQLGNTRVEKVNPLRALLSKSWGAPAAAVVAHRSDTLY
jgi:hypothetical protein